MIKICVQRSLPNNGVLTVECETNENQVSNVADLVNKLELELSEKKSDKTQPVE